MVVLLLLRLDVLIMFFFKQKTAYDMRISDWSSDVCSSDLCRVMSAFSRWLRSPRPVSVGVNTVWPAARSRAATRDQHQPPCQAPCTRTKVCAVAGRAVMDSKSGAGESAEIGRAHV